MSEYGYGPLPGIGARDPEPMDEFLDWLERDDAEPTVDPELKEAIRLYLRTIIEERDDLAAEIAHLRRVRLAAARVVAKFREEDPWIDPTQLFEEIGWLGDALDRHEP